MNLGIGLSVATSYQSIPAVGLDPDAVIAALFASGEVGAWYDPSDSTTVFQDAAGTTPAGVGDPVGLILDKSKGLVLGSELVTNGTFDTDTTGWTFRSNATGSVVSSELQVILSSTTGRGVYQDITTTIGTTYSVSATVRSASGTMSLLALTTLDTSVASVEVAANGTNQQLSLIFKATASTTRIQVSQVASGSTETYYADNISLRELPGNHATQSTATARPTLQTSGGLYYLDFDGSDDWLSTTFAAAQSQPNTLAVGWKFDAFSVLQYDFVYDTYTTGGGPRHALFDDTGSLKLNAGVIQTIQASDTVDNVGLIHFDTTSSEARINGSSVVGPVNAGSYQWGGVILGSSFDPTASRFMDGRIYGFIGVNRTLTAGEIDDVEAYLAAKSGVTI